jgi:iron(III) transport system substrate-binding protein
MTAASSKLAAVIFLVSFVTGVHAQSADWQKTWNETLAGAKTEGKVVIAGSPDPVMRNEVIPKFTARFGIPVEYIAGSGSQLTGKIRTERSGGVFAVDVLMFGADASINALYAQKMIDPIKPLLLLPEVTGGANWKRGSPWLVDREEQFVLALFSSLDSMTFINTDYVKPEELRSANDLLNPKWTGKIVAEDPTVGGSGGFTAVHYYVEKGPEFLKKLYLDQKTVISRESRQTNDWLAHGTYPICLTCRGDDVLALQKEGFKLLGIFEYADMRNRIKLSPFVLTVANKAPHPNAARVFVNWMATKEALEIYSRSFGVVTLRTGMDESFLNPAIIPRPGVSYFDGTDPDWLSKGNVEAATKVRELLKNAEGK